MTDEPSAREAAEVLALTIFGERPSTETINVMTSALLSHGRRERVRGIRDEYLTAEQVLDEIDKYGSRVVAEGARKRYGIDGVLPLHAIKASLGLTPVKMFKRDPEWRPPEHRAGETEGTQ